jgi:hypothetical protein
MSITDQMLQTKVIESVPLPQLMHCPWRISVHGRLNADQVHYSVSEQIPWFTRFYSGVPKSIAAPL